jgi:hypothetical protein
MLGSRSISEQRCYGRMSIPFTAVVTDDGNTPTLELALTLQQLVDGKCLCGRGDAGDEQYCQC